MDRRANRPDEKIGCQIFRLVEEGYNVLCLDNFFHWKQREHRHLLVKPNFELVRHDLDAPLQRQPDITLAKERLGCEPKIKLEECLMRTIEYFEGKFQ